MTVLTPTASIWSVATRITSLDSEGYPDPGNAMYVTEQKAKATITEVVETGDEAKIKNASGNLSVFAKHGEIPIWGKMVLELAIPDPALEALLTGGSLLASAASALGEPSAPTVEAFEGATGGELAEATYGYRVANYNSYGQSLATAEVTKKTTGTTGAEAVIPAAMTAGSVGVQVFGRVGGIQQYLGTVPNIGKQKLSVAIAAKAAKKGTPITVTVTALTESIPKGTLLMVTGDTSSPKAILKTLIFGVKGATTLEVENIASAENSAKIEPAEFLPVFLDTGKLTPNGNLPQADTTAGPGENVGVNAAELGVVANENGVSIEIFQRAIEKGVQAAKQPFVHWVFPRATNFHIGARDLTNANTATLLEGDLFQNLNWGSGPVGDWPFNSTKWYGRARCGRVIVPTPSYEKQEATI